MLGSWKSIAVVLAAVLTAGCSTSNTTAAASPKLYIFDCGAIDGVSPDGFGLKAEEIATPGFFTPCYLIVHPKGTLMWDTGQIPVRCLRHPRKTGGPWKNHLSHQI